MLTGWADAPKSKNEHMTVGWSRGPEFPELTDPPAAT